jgi:hypothetical protein
MSTMKERLTQRLLDLLFPSACPHEFVWPRKRQTGEHYQVCRLCGAEYLYDWFSMRRSRRVSESTMRSADPQEAVMEPQNERKQATERRRFPRYRTNLPLPLRDPLER